MSSRADALQCGHSGGGGGGDYDCDPLEPSSGDSVQSALERLASATLSSQLTSYETLSNYVIKLLKLFRTDAGWLAATLHVAQADHNLTILWHHRNHTNFLTMILP